MKTIEQSFADWENHAFGFGYGSGEDHVIRALATFFANCTGEHGSYDYQLLEAALSPVVAWLMINALCRVDVIEYGTSPRHGWLTPHGKRLHDFVLGNSLDELVEIAAMRDDVNPCCYPWACNCGLNGYEEGRVCPNPFWPDNRGFCR